MHPLQHNILDPDQSRDKQVVLLWISEGLYTSYAASLFAALVLLDLSAVFGTVCQQSLLGTTLRSENFTLYGVFLPGWPLLSGFTAGIPQVLSPRLLSHSGFRNSELILSPQVNFQADKFYFFPWPEDLNLNLTSQESGDLPKDFIYHLTAVMSLFGPNSCFSTMFLLPYLCGN